jgi:hypothetical protein
MTRKTEDRCAGVVSVALALLLCIQPGLGAQQPVWIAGSDSDMETVVLPPVDIDALKARDAAEKSENVPLRFAEPFQLNLSASKSGQWTSLPEKTLLWRRRFVSPGALSINFGMTNVFLPRGARLIVYNEGSGYVEGPFTAEHNEPHGQLWTPVIPGDSAVIEVTVPEDRKDQLSLDIATANCAYRDFFNTVPDKQGSCNIDVVCSAGDAWRDEIRSVGVYTVSGVWTCTGTLIANAKRDCRNYFLTAYHCSVTSANAASVVVYWNYEAPVCGMLSGGSLAANQSGATFRARFSGSDFCLLELNQNPDPAWNLHYAGWERGGGAALNSVCIHHPDTYEKAISFCNSTLRSTWYLGYAESGSASHWRVPAWNAGTTEPGSSGSALWNAATHRIVGQLHGGYASCSLPFESDWYGKLSVSWEGGGSSSSRLRTWLDPNGTGLSGMDGQDAGSGDDNYEENDTYETAYDFTTERTWLSNIAGLGIQADEDWYEINVSPTGFERVQVDCRFTHADGDIDIQLCNEFGTALTGAYSMGDNEFIDYAVPGPGTYYIRVYYAGAGNTYDLWWDDLLYTDSPPNLFYQGHSIDDDSTGGSLGDTNGQVNAGEIIEMPVTLHNAGNSDAHNVTATLSTSDSYVTISDGYEAFGTITTGGSAPCTADYDFAVSSNCPSKHTIIFNLAISADEGNWNDSFAVTVYAGPRHVPCDFDGDRMSDIGIYRPSAVTWYVFQSTAGPMAPFTFGAPSDLPIPADYDGDGKSDLAVFRPSTVTWYVFGSSAGPMPPFQFGTYGDRPVPADFDGDETADLAVYRPSTMTWYVFGSSAGPMPPFVFGGIGDLPIPADYDGDGKADLAVFRPSNVTWYIFGSEVGPMPPFQFGTYGDLPVPGDYDGDGIVDMAIFRPSNVTWYIFGSEVGPMLPFQFGTYGDLPLGAARYAP